MATGYLINEQCFSNVNTALQSFLSKPPLVTSSANTINYVSASSVNSTGLITFSMKNSAGTTTITNGTYQLPTCTEYGMLSDYPLIDILFIIALLLMWAFGFNAGQQR